MTPYAEIAKRLPGWIYKASAQMFIDRTYPRHLFIETTASCNLSCSYCPREKESSHMDFGLFRKIIDESNQYGPRSFSLHLFGEPLLYPRIFDAIAYIKQVNSRNTILLTTNGTKVNECVNDLVSSKVDQVYWTWRPEARFTGETVLKLRNWGKFRVRFIDEVTTPEARKLWGKWPNVEGRKMHNYGGEILIEKFKSGLKERSLKSSDTRWPCYHLWLAPAVAWNGDFLMCCADPHRKEVFGDINKESVAVAWSKLEKIRRAHLNGEYEGICQKCDVWKAYPDIFFKFQRT